MESEERAKKKEMAPEKKLLEGKTTAAEEMEKRMGNPGVSTKVLIDGLVLLQREVVAGGEDINLAGYGDACISFILKDLETTGVSKAGVEAVVTARLLTDVATVGRNNNVIVRVSHQKVQVLLRAEVHWLLAGRDRQKEYEENILAHLSQILLHGGPNVMMEFLTGLLTECYKDHQPKLLCLLYDQLNQGRLPQLLSILTPSPTQPSPSASILKRPVCDLNSSSEVMNLKT